MNPELQKALIGLIITGVTGGIVKLYLDYKAKLMDSLWHKRMEAYTNFVKLTSLFPKYPFPKQVNWQEVEALALSFRDWYFEGNGIVISRDFRQLYFNLQEHIATLLTTEKIRNKTRLEPKEYEDLRTRCSKLRTLIARELESRENPIWYQLKKKKEA